MLVGCGIGLVVRVFAGYLVLVGTVGVHVISWGVAFIPITVIALVFTAILFARFAVVTLIAIIVIAAVVKLITLITLVALITLVTLVALITLVTLVARVALIAVITLIAHAVFMFAVARVRVAPGRKRTTRRQRATGRWWRVVAAAARSIAPRCRRRVLRKLDGNCITTVTESMELTIRNFGVASVFVFNERITC